MALLLPYIFLKKNLNIITVESTLLDYRPILLCTKNVFVVWRPCMAINVVYGVITVGFSPVIILLTQCYDHHRRTRLNTMERFCI